MQPPCCPDRDVDALVDLCRRHPRLVVLTGAGISTGSGIPDYRDDDGEWKRRAPVQYLDFMRREATRKRYWARSFVGWPVMAEARPNAAHDAIARLERSGRAHHVITQNVDGLHQRAGSERVIDLHGRIDAVGCTECSTTLSRASLQVELESLNPDWTGTEARAAPDGDADVERDPAGFRVPDCPTCGGVLKPSVVFFGESVPRPWVDAAYAQVAEADALLVAGSSLMVFSGYRFARSAAADGKPVAIVNRGRTRADELASLKVEADCGRVLTAVADGLVEGAS